MKSFVLGLVSMTALIAVAPAQQVLFDTGIAGLCINNSTGGQTFLGWTSGNAGVTQPQRWSAQPFTLPAGNWNITSIDPAWFLVTGQIPTDVGYKIWSRSGQVAPTLATELYSGSVPWLGIAGEPMPVNLTLPGGDYYLTIHGIGGYFGWYTNAQGPQAIVFTDPLLPAPSTFMWRSSTYPAPGFAQYTTAAFSPDPGTITANFYCAEFILLGDPITSTSYCTAGTTSNGCNATMSSTGTPSASAGAGFVITAAGVEGQKLGILFYGVGGQAISPWGTGTSFLCVKAPTQRMGAQNAGGNAGLCDGQLATDWNLYIFVNPGALGSPFSAGQMINAQAWFRDPPAPKTTSLSNGLEFIVQP